MLKSAVIGPVALAAAVMLTAMHAVLAASIVVDTVEIFQIQGSGMRSPYEGEQVRTERNVVTAVGREGFFIQTPDARDDGDPDTSNGLYVVTGVSPEARVGQLVDVTGTVVELFDWTQLHDPAVEVRAAGVELPAPQEFDQRTPSPRQPWPANELERFEGMRVRVARGTIAGPTDRFGDACIVAGPQRTFREPGIRYPGIVGLPVFDGNPEAFRLAPDALAGQGRALTAGSSVTAVGVMAEEFDAYRLWPTELTVLAVPPQPAPVRGRRGGEVLIATQNLQRLDRDATAPPFAVRIAKLSRQIREVLAGPDVVAVQEVKDLASLSGLAARVNADDPSMGYRALHMEAPRTDEFDVGFLVRDSVDVVAVEQVGAAAIFSYDGSLLNDRPPLVLEAVVTGHEPPLAVTVVVVHQRSLNGIDDPQDGERVRRKRHEQAMWLAGWIQQRQLDRPDERLLVIGDFNAFEFTDGYVDVMGQVSGRPDPRGALIPVTAVVAPALTDWIAALPAEQRYSYVYDCDAEVLDHVLTTAAADAWVTTVALARGNADAPEGLADEGSTAARSSDHDGLVVYLGPRFRRPSGRLRP